MRKVLFFFVALLVQHEVLSLSIRPFAKVPTFRQMRPVSLMKLDASTVPLTNKAEPSAAEVLEGMYLQSTLLSLVAAAAEFIRPSLPGSPFVRHILPLYISTALAGKTLSAAAKRNRLDGTTFKLLNVGLLLSCIPTVMSTVPIAIAWQRYVMSNQIAGALASSVRLLHAYISTSTTYAALLSFGLPTIKLSMVGPLSLTYVVLALCNLYGLPMAGNGLMLESAMITSMLYALHGAAAAGAQRLSSHTYLALNGAVLISSLIKLFGLITTYPGRFTASVITQNLAFFAVPFVSLAAAGFGLYKGITYKE